MRIFKWFRILIVCCTWSVLYSQVIPQPTKWEDRLAGFEKRKLLSANHLLQNLHFESIGPTIMGGRVTDIDVAPDNSSRFYVAYASGGLWLTENNGISYKSLFDNEIVMTIGDIVVNWKNNTIWIGSGENNSSRSSYAGFGIFKSNDGGKNWKNMGLHDSHHIGRIVLHPENPDVVWVAVLGHLYSSGPERGVFKTADGGTSWKRVLFVDQNTGAIDLVIDPTNADVLFASTWERSRSAWNFRESGKGSGIYKSTDGGENWELVSTPESGFPQGEGKGRIGLAISGKDANTLFAVIDNQSRRPEKKEKEAMTSAEIRKLSADDFLKLSSESIRKFLSKNGFPEKYTVDTIKFLIRTKRINTESLADFVEDANRQLFETEVVGAELYKSSDGGKTWKRTHEGYIDDFVYSYGYYFGQVRLSPSDQNKIYIAGVPLLKSEDGGKTFSSINGDNQHVDHHALWVSPNRDGHLINGNDGGLYISYDDGANWQKVNSPPVGQFYAVNVDLAKPYNVYGGLQDNGVWMGPSTYRSGTRWQAFGKYPYKLLISGDGFKVEIDPRDNKTVYTGFQFGNYFRLNMDRNSSVKISPHHSLGQRPLRFNWQTPIHLSRHSPDILYIGSNKFHRSLNQGTTYDYTSEDLTTGGKFGDVPYGTITCIHESPLKFGMIYLGTDDGFVYRSDDIGYTWQHIDKALPAGLWVSGIQASAHDTNRLFLSLNGYRFDHFDAYIYLSGDRGQTWQRIGENLPAEPVNVIKEDPKNPDLVYIGTDNGLYISIDRGKSFMYMNNGIPAVSVHDLAIQPVKNEIVVGTHGRSLYKADVTHVELLNDSVLKKGIHLFRFPSKVYSENWGRRNNHWKEIKTVEYRMPIYVKKDGIYKMQIFAGSLNLFTDADTLEAGLNYHNYNLTLDEKILNQYRAWLGKDKKTDIAVEVADDGKYYLRPGKYKVVWKNPDGSQSASANFTIKMNEKK